jgi:subtilisin family serine protease
MNREFKIRIWLGAIIVCSCTCLAAEPEGQIPEPVTSQEETDSKVSSTPLSEEVKDTPSEVPYRITFSGLEIPNDWTRSARKLVAAGMIPTQDVAGVKGKSLCAVATQTLGFNNGHIKLTCSMEMNWYLRKLNPSVGARLKGGEVVKLPALNLEPIVETYSYDLSHGPDSARLKSDLNGYRSRYKLLGPIKNGPFTQVAYQAYKATIETLPTPVHENTLRSIVTFDSEAQRFRVSVIRLDSPAAPDHFSSDPYNSWWKSCADAHGVPPTPRPLYARYLALPAAPVCQNRCLPKNCPEIALYDRPIAPHPSLRAALRKALMAHVIDACPPLKPWNDEYHGTHMAGILASRSETDAKEGLAPNASLRSVDDKNGMSYLLDTLEDESRSSNGTNIFLIAQKLQIQELSPIIIHSDDDEILARSTFAGQVKDKPNVLWVVAAGEPKAGSPQLGSDLQPTSNFYPMSLGGFRNVIVVTACDDCFGSNPHIAPWANFSRNRLVSLAAPGGAPDDPIISTADETGYTATYGTSQAAAFVAGVAAELRSCNSGITAAQIKERLVVSAQPILDGSQGHKINSGVINASAVLNLDAMQSWVTLKSNGTPTALTNMKWCRRDVHVVHLQGGNSNDDDTIPVRSIARFKSAVDPRLQASGFMIAYNGKNDRLNEMLWTDSPVGLDPAESERALFSAIVAGSPKRQYFYPDDIDDLLLSSTRLTDVQEDRTCSAARH